VLGRRDDGYHELRTVFQSIALHDTLTIRRARGPFRLTCTDATLPLDAANLVWRAATAVWKASGRRGAPRDVAIDLIKRIPIAAGLGGGSSDAAAALRALATIWRVDAARLPALASTLGADVPYFLEGGTALGVERGDLLFPLVDQPSMHVVLAIPDFGVNTADAYRWFDERSVTATAHPRAANAFALGAEAVALPEAGNDLEAPVAQKHQEIQRIGAAFRRAGAVYAAMSGSGSAVFGLFKQSARAHAAAALAGAANRRVIVTRTLTRAACRRLAAK
jgi:4-diphosphocytidyl-2-C-methyl-D-erythritol kinase